MSPVLAHDDRLATGAGLRALVIGASAGAFDALRRLLPSIRSRDLATVVLVHQNARGDSVMHELFDDIAVLPCVGIEDKDPVRAGHVHFAPPGYHLLIERERHFALSLDPLVNFSRPSIDVLFESAAEAFGPALAALVLTGANDDGARGLAQVTRAGGLGLVQDPDEADHAAMPLAARRLGNPHAVMPLGQLAELLSGWSSTGRVPA